MAGIEGNGFPRPDRIVRALPDNDADGEVDHVPPPTRKPGESFSDFLWRWDRRRFGGFGRTEDEED